MRFQDDINTADAVALASNTLYQRETPAFHDYDTAEHYLSFLKGEIQGQLGTGVRQPATGWAALGGTSSPKGYDQVSDYLLMAGLHPELAFPGFVRQYLGVFLTEKGYVFLRDLRELAHRDGIDVSFALDYQGRQLSLPADALSLQQCYLLLHTSQQTQCQPNVRVSYAFHAA